MHTNDPVIEEALVADLARRARGEFVPAIAMHLRTRTSTLHPVLSSRDGQA